MNDWDSEHGGVGHVGALTPSHPAKFPREERCDPLGRGGPGRPLDASGIGHGTPYTLRHTFATTALAAGISLFDLSRFMGTSIEQIDKTYGHLAAGSEQAALAKLDALDA
jgi:integrase